MRRISYGILLALLFTPSVYAVGEVEQTCEEKYPISRTESSPRQFLLRRCIQNERKKLINERQAERQQMRDAARYDKSAARSQALRTLSENTTQDAIRRQTLRSNVSVHEQTLLIRLHFTKHDKVDAHSFVAQKALIELMPSAGK